MRTVVKFGGSNLKSDEDISKIVQVIRAYNQPLVIVVSALFGVTSKLIETLERVQEDITQIESIKKYLIDIHVDILNKYIEEEHEREKIKLGLNERTDKLGKYLTGINFLGEYPEFARDIVLSYGERLSAFLLYSVLNSYGIECQKLTPEELGLKTDGKHWNATVDIEASKESVTNRIKGEQTIVVPGFYGVSTEGKVTLLGRGGSDYSAAAIASCIEADSLDIWKDVHGFMSADPKIIKNPITVENLSYNEAAELSYFGARIVHPRTFEPLKEMGIPVRVFNIDRIDPKLTPISIIGTQKIASENIVKSVTFTDDVALLKLMGPGVGIIGGIISEVSSRLSEKSINIKSIVTSQTHINFLLAKENLKKANQILSLADIRGIEKIETMENISLLAIVGLGMDQRPGIAAKVLTAISKTDTNVILLTAGASPVASYYIVSRTDKDRSIQAVHDAFFGTQ